MYNDSIFAKNLPHNSSSNNLNWSTIFSLKITEKYKDIFNLEDDQYLDEEKEKESSDKHNINPDVEPNQSSIDEANPNQNADTSLIQSRSKFSKSNENLSLADIKSAWERSNLTLSNLQRLLDQENEKQGQQVEDVPGVNEESESQKLVEENQPDVEDEKLDEEIKSLKEEIRFHRRELRKLQKRLFK